MWSVLILALALATSQSCTDPFCVSCESTSGVELCHECGEGLFPLESACLACDSQPLSCDLAMNGRWSCYCSATNSKTELSELPSPFSHCLPEQPCLVCSSKHYLDDDNICQPCTDNCRSCVSKDFCLDCEDEFSAIGGYCCEDNCLACDSVECFACPEGFELANGRCEPQEKLCIDSCLECLDYLFCTKCRDGYYLSDDLCLECSDDIEECNVRKLESGNNCKTATEWDDCYSCYPGNYLCKKKCLKCNNLCDNCDWEDACTSCKPGLKLVSGYCCDPKCTKCSFNKCWGCEKGFLLKDGECVDCPQDCDSCENGLCIKVKCSSSCSSCDAKGCLRCEAGYYLADNACNPCSTDCKTCDSLNQCTGCYSPLVLKTQSCCVEGCEYCTYGKCWRCQDDWLYDDSSCKPCPSNCSSCKKGVCIEWKCISKCESCENSKTCLKCVAGYYLESAECVKCDDTCETCDSAKQCTSCDKELELISGFCCDPKCSSCNIDKCLGCKSGFLFEKDVCKECPAKCGGCPNGVCESETKTLCPETCSSCVDGVCVTTSGQGTDSNCKKWSGTKCDKCNDGYYPKSGGCTKCHSQCLECDWEESCTSCADNHHIVGGFCCQTGCKECDLNVCWECNKGYVYNSVTKQCD